MDLIEVSKGDLITFIDGLLYALDDFDPNHKHYVQLRSNATKFIDWIKKHPEKMTLDQVNSELINLKADFARYKRHNA